MFKLRPGVALLAAAAFGVSAIAAVLFFVNSPGAPYIVATACLAWGFAGAKQLSSSSSSLPAGYGPSAGRPLFRMELVQLRSHQEQMKANGYRNLIPEILMVSDADAHEYVYLSAGKAKRAGGEKFRTCIGMLRFAESPVCIRVDISEEFLFSEGAEIDGIQASSVVKEFAGAKPIVM